MWLALAMCVLVVVVFASRYQVARTSAPNVAGASRIFKLDERRRLLAGAFRDARGRVCCDDEAQCAAIVAKMDARTKIGHIFQPNWVMFRGPSSQLLAAVGGGSLARDARPLCDDDAAPVARHGFGAVLGDGSA